MIQNKPLVYCSRCGTFTCHYVDEPRIESRLCVPHPSAVAPTIFPPGAKK